MDKLTKFVKASPNKEVPKKRKNSPLKNMLPRDLRPAGFIDSTGAIQFTEKQKGREFDDSYTQAMMQKLMNGTNSSNTVTSGSRKND